jgi:hypothetical protein
VRSYEAEHEANIWNLGTGVFISVTALSSFSCLLGLNRLFALHAAVNPAVTVALALCVSFALAARVSMVDLWRTMEHNTRLVIVIFTGALFMVGGYAAGRWNLLAGLVTLHLPAAFTLVSERGFARMYLLSSLTACFAVIGWNQQLCVLVLALYAFLLFQVLAYESFYDRVVVQPVSTRINPWLPGALALGRFLLFGGVAGLLWRVLPLPRAFLREGAPGAEDEQRGPAPDPSHFNANLLKAFLYTMALILLLLALIALLRYLHAKFKRKHGEVLPESIGVPVSAPERLPRAERRARGPRADDPLEQIVKEYQRFSSALKSELAHRAPSQTPEEYARRLRNLAALPSPLVRDITAEFSAARYTPDEVTWKQAEEFTGLVERAIRTEEESASS